MAKQEKIKATKDNRDKKRPGVTPPENAPVDSNAPPAAPDAPEAEATENVERTAATETQTIPPGIDPKEIAAQLRPLITQSVIETLKELNLGDQISKVAGEAVDAKINPLLEQMKSIIPALAGGGSAGVQPSGEAHDNAKAQGGGIGETILAALIPRLLGGNGGGNGMSQMEDFVKAMAAFQDMSRSFYITPQLDSLNMYSTLFKTGASVGKTPSELASTADTIAKSIREASKTKPTE